jgi:hypothetical protein
VKTRKFLILMQIFMICLITLSESDSAAAPKKIRKKRGQQTVTPKVTPFPKEKPAPRKKDATSTVIEVSDITSDDTERTTNKPIDRLFRNPVLAAGLISGADAINKSIDTLMESLFYSLLDNKLKYPLAGPVSGGLGITRDVYNARDGAYVVIDRFGLGPEYAREVYRYNDIPVLLGATQSTDVYDIYLRTDPMRITENKTLPFWRVALNNWFGALPLLEAILPPSFNPNEMYDPLRRLEAPFTFPLSIEAAKSMDLGSIKSYSVNGGINLGLETAQGIHGFKDQVMTGQTALEMKLPYTVFRTGEYRINVLKKDSNTMLVGVMDATRLGHRVETKLGKTYFLLSKTIPLWRGMPAPVFPLDFAMEEVIGDLFGRVYSFDLRNDEAKTAFIEAVHGDFAAAQVSWLRAVEEKLETGVKFFYTKKERRFETAFAMGHNIYLTSRRTNRTHSAAEIEINDASGRYFVLEAKEDSDQKRFDMLTGRAETNVTLQADLLVRKVVEQELGEDVIKSRYEFIAEGNPIDITFNLSLNDKFVETEDLNFYLNLLSRFTQLKLDGLPEFPIRDKDDVSRRRREVFFYHDNDSKHKIHVTPTHLGQLEGYASVKMTNEQLLAVASLPRIELWKKFCAAFEVQNEETCLIWEKSLVWRNLYRLNKYLTLPLRLIDYKIRAADTVDEIEQAIAALKEFLNGEKPAEKQVALRKLFSTEYPLEVAEAILIASDLRYIPRSCEIQTKPKGNASREIKDKFKSMDGHRFTSETSFPAARRHDSTKETEKNFDPANLAFAGSKPRIQKITLFKETETNSNLQQMPNEEEIKSLAPILATKISVSKIGSAERLSVYMKLEQSGRVQLAKLKLFEDVLDVPLPVDIATVPPDRANFMVMLSGPRSLLATIVSEESLANGGEFKLTLSVSANGLIWSDEKSLEFRIEGGELKSR